MIYDFKEIHKWQKSRGFLDCLNFFVIFYFLKQYLMINILILYYSYNAKT